MAKLTAKNSDKHFLYELSVQEPEADLDFAERLYRKARGKYPSLLREDFCGTAAISCEWVKRRRSNRSLGVDLDAKVLEWGRRHNLAPLGEKAERVTLVEGDVLDVLRPKADLTLAMNFSYWIFKTRPELIYYLRAAYKALKPDGMMMLDAFGGSDAQVVLHEKKRVAGHGFTYVWEQAKFNPVNSDITCHIHFEFRDGTVMRRAFTYHWRLWTLVEVCEALRVAGFRTADVYWEGEDADGEGNGIFRRTKRAENAPGWIAYIVAAK